jgi:hypothetical protein
MRKTTKRNFSDSQILSRAHELLQLGKWLNEENQMNKENLFHLDNLLDSELASDLKFLPDSEDPFDFDDFEDPFELRISDLRWDDDQPQFHS